MCELQARLVKSRPFKFHMLQFRRMNECRKRFGLMYAKNTARHVLAYKME